MGTALRTRRVVRYSFCTCGRSISTKNAACPGVTLALFLRRCGSALEKPREFEIRLHYASKRAARARGGARHAADVWRARGACKPRTSAAKAGPLLLRECRGPSNPPPAGSQDELRPRPRKSTESPHRIIQWASNAGLVCARRRLRRGVRREWSAERSLPGRA